MISNVLDSAAVLYMEGRNRRDGALSSVDVILALPRQRDWADENIQNIEDYAL